MFSKDGENWVSGETASDGELVLRRNHRGSPPITMATAATAPKAAASRLRIALSPTAPPFFPVPELAASEVGSKGSGWRVTAAVSPGVGVTDSKKESGSPVDAIPVGVAVIDMSSSSIPNAPHASSKSIPKPFATSMGPKGQER